MKRFQAATLLAFLAVTSAWADPPKLSIPAEVRPDGQYIQFVPETDAVSVTYVGLSGVEPVPNTYLTDKRAFILDTLGKTPGRYTFVAVAAGKTGEQSRQRFDAVIGTPPVVPPPTQPPTEPPTQPSASLYFLIVRPDGPAQPSFTKTMQLPEWELLIKQGHTFKDKTQSEAAKLGINVSTPIPCVVTLKVAADNKSSKVVRGPVALPTTGAEIIKLPEGVK